MTLLGVSALTVSNTNDSGAGSLRELVNTAASGATIDFDPSLSGMTITLTSGPVILGSDVTIQGRDLPVGITISGGGTSRIFEIAEGVTAEIDSLTLRDGRAPAGANGTNGTSLGESGAVGGAGGDGGAILNRGTLTVRRSLLASNVAGAGGRGGNASFGNGGAGGRGGSGGAIHNSPTGILTVLDSTIDGNVAGVGGNGGIGLVSAPGGGGGHGGGISNESQLTLRHVTLTTNVAGGGGTGGFITAAPGAGGGVWTNGTLSIANSVVAGNTLSIGSSSDVTGSLTTESGVNFLGSGFVASATRLIGDPLLGPLTGNGGRTSSRLPQSGSPVINTSTLVVSDTDQRGYSRDTTPDLGSVEVGGALLVETLADTMDSRPLSLRKALELVATGEMIRFDPGLSGQSLTLTLGQLNLSRNVTIDASNLDKPIVIDANGASTGHRVLAVPTGVTARLDSLVLMGGVTGSGQDGGGIHNEGDLTLQRVSVIDNRTGNGANAKAGHGGGIYHAGGTLTLIRSLVARNRTGRGGSASIIGPGFAGGDGGGIYCNGILMAEHCTIDGNLCGAGGNGVGPIQNGGSGGSGGGLYNAGQVELIHTTVSDNGVGLGGSGSSLGGLTGSSGPAGRGDGFYQGAGTSLVIENSVLGSNGGTDLFSEGTVAEEQVNLLSTIASSGLVASNGLLVADPLLAALGNYGGPTFSRPPRSGSPLLEAARNSSGSQDQRGAPRLWDADGDGSDDPDLGAVEFQEITVTTVLDENDLPAGAQVSLREAIATDFVSYVQFDAALSGETIVLEHGQLEFEQGMEIDGSNLPELLTIDANGSTTGHRVLRVLPQVNAEVRGLALTGGRPVVGEHGGGIHNSGHLVLDEVSVTNNVAGREGHGGGIFHEAGQLVIGRSLIAGNRSGTFRSGSISMQGSNGSQGGGIYAQAPLIIESSSIITNAAGDGAPGLDFGIGTTPPGGAGVGGGIYVRDASVELSHVTLSENAAGLSGRGALGAGGGIYHAGSATVAIESVVCDAQTGTTIDGTGSVTTSGVSVFESLEGSGISPGSAVVFADPQLLPLGDYGGKTHSRPLCPSSPAIDAVGSGGICSSSTDQRGLPRISGMNADSGACEHQGAAETFWDADTDDDGVPFREEMALGTNPFVSDADSDKNLAFVQAGNPGEMAIRFGINLEAMPYTAWVLKRSTNMVDFDEVYRIDGPSQMQTLLGDLASQFDPPLAPNMVTITDRMPPGDRVFYRFDAVDPAQP